MGRLNKTGVRGLVRETVTDAAGVVVERWSIDLRYRDANGVPQRFRERLPDGIKAAAAKKRAIDVNNAAAAGTLSAETGAPKLLGEALDEYLKWAETNRPRSYIFKRSQCRALKRIVGASTELNRLSIFTVENFKKKRGEEGSPTTVNHGIITLKHAVRMFVTWRWMRPGVASEICAIKKLKTPKGRVRELSEGEEAAILAKLPPVMRLIMRASELSGMRRGEVALLRREQVNLTTREIRLRHTKNGNERTVPINDGLDAILREAMAEPAEHEFVFVSRRNQPYALAAVSQAFRRAARQAGVTNVRYHDTRHTWASRLRRRDVQLDVLMDMGGWSSLEMVRRYAHVGQKEMHDAARLLDSPARIAQDSREKDEEEDQKTESIRKVTLR